MSFSLGIKGASLFVFLFVLSLFVPSAVDAATAKVKTVAAIPKNLYISGYRYGDEKTVFGDVTTRCVTPATKALRAKDVKQAVKDEETFNIKGDEELEKIYKKYLDGLDISWEAMLEPYCGYGSHGVAAAQKSYVKTVTRVRANFLAQVKKIQAEDKEDES